MTTAHSLSKRTFGINAVLAAIACLAIILPSSLVGQGSPATTPYVATMTFDVASIKENKTIDPSVGFTMSGRFVPHTSTFHAINWPIESLIGIAYGADRAQLVGTPKWTFPTLFVVEAKGDSEADARIERSPRISSWLSRDTWFRRCSRSVSG
jgi:hypothetical protein